LEPPQKLSSGLSGVAISVSYSMTLSSELSQYVSGVADRCGEGGKEAETLSRDTEREGEAGTSISSIVVCRGGSFSFSGDDCSVRRGPYARAGGDGERTRRPKSRRREVAAVTVLLRRRPETPLMSDMLSLRRRLGAGVVCGSSSGLFSLFMSCACSSSLACGPSSGPRLNGKRLWRLRSSAEVY